jgi:hypothetical protein
VNGCVRRAWLTLPGRSIDLEDDDAGYYCTNLDLGYPEVRDVVSNRPDQHGTDDRTSLWGSRAVSAELTAFADRGEIDAVLSMFAPFLNVAARPVLHWVLDRPGTAERVLTLRPSSFAAPIAGPYERNVQLSWVAADPIPRDPLVQSGMAWSGSGVAGGRTYDLAFPRSYPFGSGGPGATTYHVHNGGELPLFLVLRIYGPITGPRVTLHNNDGSGDGSVRFVSSYIVNANEYVEVDMARKTAFVNGDPNRSAMSAVDWIGSTWCVVNPYVAAIGGNICQVSLAGTSTSAITQVQAFWQDPYLT